MGLIATILNFILRPEASHFLGFTAASFVFDLTTVLIGYNNLLKRGIPSYVLLVAVSVLSTLVAGTIIGSFFLNPTFLQNMFGGVILYTLIHGAGGLIGGLLGVSIMKGLQTRLLEVLGLDEL
jgi:hypothetical protein